MTWYYIDESVTEGDRRKGPFHLDEIKELVQKKQITEETLVWHSGLDKFIPWKDMEESKESVEESAQNEEELLKKTIEELLARQVQQHNQQKFYAGFFTRGFALIIDNIILTAVTILLVQLLGAMGVIDLAAISQALEQVVGANASDDFTETLTRMMNDTNLEIVFTLASVLQALYFIIFTAVRGATPGKALLHLKVETAEGNRIGWLGSIVRYIASIFTQLTLMLYGLGYIIVVIDPKRRALHDHIARSRVIFQPVIKIRSVKEQEK